MPDNNTPSQWVNIKQAMEITGVCRRTIHNWIKANRVTWRKTAGNGTRILESSLWKKGMGS